MQQTDFASKRNALFACLDDASKEIKGTILDQGEMPRYNLKRNRTDMESGRTLAFMRGKESIFKKPELPITRCLKARKTPDYQVNPHKWKKYSLSDVDISDHTNTAAAFSFLKQMDEQRHETCDDDADDEHNVASTSSHKKIEFKKSSKIARNLRALEDSELADAEVDKPKLKGSKLVMPEYVVGQKKIVRNRQQRSSNTSKKAEKTRAAGSLRLSHLQDEDENEDDSDQDDFMAER